ncbi:MAG TPA: cellulase family glycosylhydrolase [Povalibacter sp.]|nr:cellulase family glycosylhydrolase [Povalibacter sp.]
MQRTSRKIVSAISRAAIAALLLAVIASCGGGGSGSASAPPPGTGSVNRAPVMTSGASVTVVSGSSGVVYTASASDADNDTLSYAVSGEDAAAFVLDAGSGALRFRNPPDAATPGDANRDNDYRITVTVSDGKASASRDVSVVVMAVAGTGMREITSLELAQEMSPGWNLGNTLEAMPSETAWGNPPASQALLNAVRAAGFRSVRIPVSWSQYADANYNISPAWMARVTEVVNSARNADLYVIVNIHWDGGWMQPTYARQAEVNARLTKLWTQIANNFKGYDDHVLFAGTNEVMVDGDYGTPTVEYYRVQNSFNQAFVDAVRATGGNNALRHLIVQGFNTNIDHTVSFATLPADSVAHRLMMEVHYYDPYNFTLNTSSAIWQWGASATDPAATETWANESWADAQFQKMKARFVDQGVPVILGEYCASLRTEYDPDGIFRARWDEYITRSAHQHGLVPIYWDAGATGNHGSGLFNRVSGAQTYPDLVARIVSAAR